YLETTIGMEARLVGALSFLASRVIGSAFRLFLVVLLLQHFVLDPLHIPIEVTVIITLLLIFAYTATGGVKTLVYTDTLQTSVMLICAGVTLYLLACEIGDFSALQASISHTTFDFEEFRNNDNHFVKQFLGGALLAFCMTGLDQDMMQKNLTCKDSISGQKNIITLSLLLIPINLLFLGLGYYLSIFAQEANLLVERPDHLFPTVIFSSGTFSAALGGLFVLGLIAAALSSADSALTSLTTCFQVDILQDKTFSSKKRLLIHGSFALLLAAIILGFYYAPNGESIINRIFTVAQYTYGPLLGLFLFAMSAKRKVKSIYIPILCMLTIGLTLWCQLLLTKDLNFSPGFLLLGINGTIMYSLLVITSTKDLSYEK
ncbi:MAG: sodium:solute symporter, partial [Bacteroidota bacterium]|nr:sodium:solute symporter [Bacteroidota bacterium]